MGLFKRVFDRNQREASNEQPDSTTASTALIFVFDQLPRIDKDRMARTIEHIELIKTRATIAVTVEEHDTCYAAIEFDDHRLHLAGFAAPVPSPAIERTIQAANWRQDQKEPLRKHRAHIICFYDGSSLDPIEQMIALYKVAYSFYDQGLLGVLDETAWNCMPREFVKDQVSPEMLKACRDDIPLGIWTGFVKLFRPDEKVWFCTKGHHRFGVNDFAYLGQIHEADEVFEMFQMLFGYVHDYKAVLKVGDTAQAGEELYLRFRAVDEYHDYLASPSGTLVVEKMSTSQ